MSPTPPDAAGGPPNGEPGDGSPSESFLSRRTWGLSHYLWISLAVTFALVFIPRGARKALESNTNKAEDWLPANYSESADLMWFRDHFAHDSFILISWDGCTLGNTEKMRLLEQKLRAVKDDQGDWAWYPRVVTGPDTVETLTTGAASLSRNAAIERLEGALVGPEKIGPDGETLGDGSRVTCLLAYLDDRLTDSNRQMRVAVERVRDIAHEQCGVPLEAIHMGGPPVDNITIDIEGERTLIRLAGLSGLVGISLAYLCFRSKKITAMVFWTAGASAGMSLSLVYWFGGFEMFLMGLSQPRLGTADAILMSMPAVVYVLALSGAIHLVNYYKDERIDRGQFGAVERAVRVAWVPCLLAAFTTAVGLGSLAASDILPIQKFGIFSAIGVMVAVALLFSIMPVFLHRFPPSRRVVEDKNRRMPKEPRERQSMPWHLFSFVPYRRHFALLDLIYRNFLQPAGANDPAWHAPLARFVTRRHTLTLTCCLVLMGIAALGLPKIHTSVQLLGLLDEDCDLIHDYAWLEANLGNLVPMEVIVALDDDQLRSPYEKAVDLQADDAKPRYRMTMYERAELVRTLQAQVESLDEVSRALSAATFGAKPQDAGGSASARRAVESATSEAMESSRRDLNEYLLAEETDGKRTGRELWRVSARVTALGDVDYGHFVEDLRGKIEPVLDAYKVRDLLVAKLAAQGIPLDEARVCLLTDTNDPENPWLPKPGSPEAWLADLLQSSATKDFTVYPLATFQAADPERRAQTLQQLAERFDAVVTLNAANAAPLKGVDVATLALTAPGVEATPPTEATAVYTGIVPLVYKTQRELLTSLRQSIIWATGLIACVMMFVLRSPPAGVASMLPNVFPIVMVFGVIGWIGIKVDIGIMMAASVALGVAVDDTLHFVTWFSRGIRSGLDRRSATEQAFDRCATAMMQTTLIGGMGLAVFAVSTFTPTQQFGTLMITILAVALIGDLVMLPALLCGPLGRFFAPKAPATPEEAQSRRAPSPVAQPGSAHSGSAQPQVSPAAVPVHAEPIVSPAGDAADEPLSAANAALRTKLQRFRRQPSNDPSN
ncbi:MMPL family protein [Botrimarina colliarenosi]|uniref:MMPL family protein n=1 Tax=Botrimarina colliarenosi TaxID=2528001 RepID=A0A5C6AKX3_9BACT|nr:MMPL family transporter [Botrimarina colliarenosi]TWU00675.1 MMPL family protein [Botrimarina colliarenosi]